MHNPLFMGSIRGVSLAIAALKETFGIDVTAQPELAL